MGEVTKLTASDAADFDRFGYAVAISGDTAIVGARYVADPSFGAGAVYVYERNFGGPNNWGEVIKRAASDAAGDAWYGIAVAVSGDTAVVGAEGDHGFGVVAGSAYVLERDLGGPNNWGEAVKLNASDGTDSDRFGNAVAISGDRLIVAARFNDDLASAAGSAYLYERDAGGPGNWGEVKKLTAPDAAAIDYFGSSVAIDGDRVAVGAFFDDDGGDNSGSVYLFERDAGGVGNWGLVKKLGASDAADGDRFGQAVSLPGDTLLVTANRTDDAGVDSGAVYVFERNSGGPDAWGETSKLLASDAGAGDQFGTQLSVDGELAVVGAPFEDDVRTDSGAAYVDQPGTNPDRNWPPRS